MAPTLRAFFLLASWLMISSSQKRSDKLFIVSRLSDQKVMLTEDKVFSYDSSATLYNEMIDDHFNRYYISNSHFDFYNHQLSEFEIRDSSLILSSDRTPTKIKVGNIYEKTSSVEKSFNQFLTDSHIEIDTAKNRISSIRLWTNW